MLTSCSMAAPAIINVSQRRHWPCISFVSCIFIGVVFCQINCHSLVLHVKFYNEGNNFKPMKKGPILVTVCFCAESALSTHQLNYLGVQILAATSSLPNNKWNLKPNLPKWLLTQNIANHDSCRELSSFIVKKYLSISCGDLILILLWAMQQKSTAARFISVAKFHYSSPFQCTMRLSWVTFGQWMNSSDRCYNCSRIFTVMAIGPASTGTLVRWCTILYVT